MMHRFPSAIVGTLISFSYAFIHALGGNLSQGYISATKQTPMRETKKLVTIMVN